MSQERKVEELFPRAPRYVIEVGDQEVLRFAQAPRNSKAMYTRIIDLSETGMAFLCPFLSAPMENETIKVEFTAPNTEAIACFAKVVRIQNHRSYDTFGQRQTFKLVAVEFKDLPPKQRANLSKGLTEKFKQKRQVYLRKQWMYSLLYIALKPWRFWQSLQTKKAGTIEIIHRD